MKTIKAFAIVFLLFMAVSCDDPGVTYNKLQGNEANLPDELKGLKVYAVSTGNGDYVKVAVLNGEVNSSTYMVGKTHQTTIVVRKDHYDERQIEVKEILMENDSLMLIRKK
jgi:hypothetical protein